MLITEWKKGLKKVARKMRTEFNDKRPAGIHKFAHPGERVDTGAAPTEIEDLFWNNTGTIVHKWHHYLPLYDRYFQPWKNRPVKMLEIGVSKGGSLALWRRYFGPDAIIFGIDIDQNCAKFNGLNGQVRIGSQDDPVFLRAVAEEMGGIDIVLDDGSHVAKHMDASLDVLFPILSVGGIYVLEDLHTSYWPSHGGGNDENSGFTKTMKTLIDDMHHWYHSQGQKVAGTCDYLAAMHVHDSLVVLEKEMLVRPKHSKRGTE